MEYIINKFYHIKNANIAYSNEWPAVLIQKLVHSVVHEGMSFQLEDISDREYLRSVFANLLISAKDVVD
jgi:hypothetical protein